MEEQNTGETREKHGSNTDGNRRLNAKLTKPHARALSHMLIPAASRRRSSRRPTESQVARHPKRNGHGTAESNIRREKPRPAGGRGARERPCGDPQGTPPSHNPRQKPHGRNPSPTEHVPPHRADAPRPPGRTDFFFF